jgi:Ca2+/Na+ antiporter
MTWLFFLFYLIIYFGFFLVSDKKSVIYYLLGWTLLFFLFLFLFSFSSGQRGKREGEEGFGSHMGGQVLWDVVVNSIWPFLVILPHLISRDWVSGWVYVVYRLYRLSWTLLLLLEKLEERERERERKRERVHASTTVNDWISFHYTAHTHTPTRVCNSTQPSQVLGICWPCLPRRQGYCV